VLETRLKNVHGNAVSFRWPGDSTGAISKELRVFIRINKNALAKLPVNHMEMAVLQVMKDYVRGTVDFGDAPGIKRHASLNADGVVIVTEGAPTRPLCAAVRPSIWSSLLTAITSATTS
jgi:hypothetical protein